MSGDDIGYEHGAPSYEHGTAPSHELAVGTTDALIAQRISEDACQHRRYHKSWCCRHCVKDRVVAAIRAEREACAQIAETCNGLVWGSNIAAGIRARSRPK